MKLETIQRAVEETKKFPKAHIEYNGELPEHEEVTPNKFFGIKAVLNPRVPKSVGCNVIFTY